MKSVLMSIHPKWCKLIASGKKTIEVRKQSQLLKRRLSAIFIAHMIIAKTLYTFMSIADMGEKRLVLSVIGEAEKMSLM